MDAWKCTNILLARKFIEKLKAAEEQADKEGWISAENIKNELDILKVPNEKNVIVGNLKRGKALPVVDLSDLE